MRSHLLPATLLAAGMGIGWIVSGSLSNSPQLAKFSNVPELPQARTHSNSSATKPASNTTIQSFYSCATRANNQDDLLTLILEAQRLIKHVWTAAARLLWIS